MTEVVLCPKSKTQAPTDHFVGIAHTNLNIYVCVYIIVFNQGNAVRT
jgi:hypothetical protein